MNIIVNILNEIRLVAGQMSPYLLFGFLAAGILHILVSPTWMRRHLGGRGVMPVVKSVLLGVPLPLCSCGVIAVTASMRRQGAGRVRPPDSCWRHRKPVWIPLRQPGA